MSNFKSYLSCSVALLTLSLAAGQALAQEAEPGRLEEVVVTARRVEENLQKTPVAVTAMSEKELEAKGVASLLDIGNFVPNVVVGSQSTTGGQNGGFFIRGIGQDRSGIAFDQGVGLYVDDVYYSRSDSNLLAVLDVDRVEVLRGPQGTLFGKNTIGGAVRYMTKKPTAGFGGYVEATLGNFDRRDFKASVNVPISDAVFVKLTAGSLKRDGYVTEVAGDRTFGDQNTQVERFQFRYVPNDKLTIDFDATAMQTDTNGRAYTIDYLSPNGTYARVLKTKTGLVYDNSYLTNDPYKIYGGRPTSYTFDGYSLGATIAYELTDNLTVKSITGYLRNDIRYVNDYDGTPLPIFDYTTNRSVNQFSQEFQLAGSLFEERLNFVSGLYYLTEGPKDYTSTVTVNDAFYPTPRVVSQDSSVKSYAAYAQGTFKFTDKLSTTAGLRYSKDDKDFATANYTTRLAGAGKGSWDEISPRLSVEYQWSPDMMSYASATRGFRSGGLNAGLSPTLAGVSQTDKTQALLPYDPERVTGYELGMRSTFFKRLRVNATAFYMKYENQQLTALNSAINQTYVQNVGRSHLQGLELESMLAVTDHLTLQGTAGLLKSEYDSVGSATGISVKTRPLRTPAQTYSASANYKHETPWGQARFSVAYNWVASQTTTSTASNSVRLDSYGLVSSRVEFTPTNADWSVAVFGTNLTDEVYYIGGIDFARRETLIGISQLDVGAPRQVGIQLRYNF